ncbi:MAG: MerR family transcriptional regulator [Pseudomonadota bacterium]
MTIGDFARMCGVSQRTVHYYERLGLISPATREGTGYRYYDEASVRRLEKIAALKRVGLSLDEIASVIDLYFEDASGIRGKQQVLKILKTHLAETEAKLSELRQFRKETADNIARIEALLAEAKS